MKEIESILGTEDQQAEFKGKTVKKIDFPKLQIYNTRYPFDRWWKSFKYAIKTSGLVGHVKQIQFSFSNYMDFTIQNYFELLTENDELDLKNMVIIVLSLYDKSSKTLTDLKKEFYSIKKKDNEPIAIYYFRVLKAAEKAQINDIPSIKQIYVEGISPVDLYLAVIRKVEKDTTLEETHEIALKEEDSLQKVKKKEYQINNNFNTNNNNKINNTNNYKNFNNRYNNSNNNNKNNNNKSHKNENNDRFNNKNNNNSTENKKPTMTEDGICLYCDKKHDSKECYNGKFKFFTVEEAKLLKKANLQPRKRIERPQYRITENTKFIKDAMERIAQQNANPKKF